METQGGNSCLYFLFRVGTLCLIIVGLANVTAGVAVCVEANNINWYNGGFIALGLIMIILAFLGHKTRYARSGIKWYLLFLVLTFLTELGFTFGIIFY